MAKDAATLFSQMDSYVNAKDRFESRLSGSMAERVPSTHILRVRVNADGLLEFIKAELQEDMLGVTVGGKNSYEG